MITEKFNPPIRVVMEQGIEKSVIRKKFILIIHIILINVQFIVPFGLLR